MSRVESEGISSDFRLKGRPPKLGVSVVIPVHDERQNIEKLYSELRDALDRLENSWEIVFVDDGSTDGSCELLRTFSKIDQRIILVKHENCLGQTLAIKSGIEASSNDTIVTMDADLQHDPAAIPALIEAIGQGHDMVCARLENRLMTDAVLGKVLPSLIANALISVLFRVGVSQSTTGMRAFRRSCVMGIPWFRGAHRFLPVMAAIKGARIGEIPVRARSRFKGKSKYSPKRFLEGLVGLHHLKAFQKEQKRREASLHATKAYKSCLGPCAGK